MLECRFFVPIKEQKGIGSGDVHPTSKWERLQKDLSVSFGAWTISPGLYEGEYEKDRDQSRQYIVALEEEQVPKLRAYLQTYVALEFVQKVIYFFNGREVELLDRIEPPES